ncbi:hypothetical protein [Flindersiella endophytica]
MPHAARLGCGCRTVRPSLGLEATGPRSHSGGPAGLLPAESMAPMTDAAPTHPLRIEES